MFKKIVKKQDNPLESLDSINLDTDIEINKNKKKSKYGSDLVPGESRAYFELFSIHANATKKWQRITMIALGIAALAIVNDRISGGTKYVPVLITQNDVGQMTPLGVFEGKNIKVDEKVVIGQIYTYLTDVRSVVQDLKIETTRRDQISLLTSERDNDKMLKMFFKQLSDAAQDTISIEVTQIMPIRNASNTSWKVQWNESYGSSPNIIKKYEAIFNAEVKEVTTNDPSKIALNPTGIQFSNFTMSQVFDSSNQKNKDNSDDSSNQ